MANSKVVMGIDDVHMWEAMKQGRLELQRCDNCHAWRYPPAPICPKCLSEKSTWTPVSGEGTIMSWVVFHKKYFDDHLPPYNSVAVELDEGPIVVSQLQGREPEGSWIGERVTFGFAEHAGRIQHYIILAETADHTEGS
jgi:uncharacterized OB-fold protein